MEVGKIGRVEEWKEEVDRTDVERKNGNFPRESHFVGLS